MDAVAARAVLHYVLEGRCRIAATGAAPLEPARGELVLLPAAARHRVLAAPADQGVPARPPDVPDSPDGPAARVAVLDGPGPPARLLSLRT
ncbi:cupin domain-containing protein, partial [Streptomyces sp. NPDC051771]|uniref:cupin domain-containing protein n=1 Tax=Streptomyces sp. NPDC051771 TaxID=3154847 RepID=UPI003429C811